MVAHPNAFKTNPDMCPESGNLEREKWSFYIIPSPFLDLYSSLDN